MSFGVVAAKLSKREAAILKMMFPERPLYKTWRFIESKSPEELDALLDGLEELQALGEEDQEEELPF